MCMSIRLHIFILAPYFYQVSTSGDSPGVGLHVDTTAHFSSSKEGSEWTLENLFVFSKCNIVINQWNSLPSQTLYIIILLTQLNTFQLHWN